MQSREIDLGVIYILVGEGVLQADELLAEDRWRGAGIESTVPGDTAMEGGGRWATMCQPEPSRDRFTEP